MSDKATAIEGPWGMLGKGEAIVGNHGKRPVVVAAAMLGEHAGKLVTRDPDTGLLVRLTYDHPNARVITAAPTMLDALKAQHEAIDRLFAMLVGHTRSPHPALADSVFMPSKSGQPWEACMLGNAAIALATPEAD